MKTLLLGAILLVTAMAVPGPTKAEVDVSIGISLPPAIVFQAPPEVIVLPDTSNVYIVPELEVDLFFWNGWWWRPWEGRWYRSRYYDRGWVYYRSVPSWYFDVDPGWRRYYRERNWYGHPWSYERIPHRRLQRNWKSWNTNRYWERQRTWGVQSYRPHRPQQRQELRRQRQEQYRQRPEVQRHQQERLQQQRQQERRPQVRQPRGQDQPRQRQSEPRGRQHQEEKQQKRSQGNHDRGNGGHGR